ncbi:MAG: hypothetical protein ABJF11_03270 [Reichenbachiella sp.]|uniref:hypothetical protein n=1 Tax=Reichenbachiella sp. TaxID=2184521 RepID=UPI0032674821
MLDFLTAWDVIISIVVVLIIFALFRGIQILKTKDVYLEWEHLIKPGLVVTLVLLLIIGVRYTERIWYNLAYINDYEVRTLMLDWPEVNTPDTSQARALSLYLEQRKTWPVSLIGNPRNTDSIPIIINGIKGDTIASFIRKDTVYWDAKDDTLIRTTKHTLNFDTLNFLLASVNEQNQLLSDSLLLYKDSLYTMKIDTWVVSDTLRVQLLEDKGSPANESEN